MNWYYGNCVKRQDFAGQSIKQTEGVLPRLAFDHH